MRATRAIADGRLDVEPTAHGYDGPSSLQDVFVEFESRESEHAKVLVSPNN